jgi:hypothetical protein
MVTVVLDGLNTIDTEPLSVPDMLDRISLVIISSDLKVKHNNVF